MGVTITDLAFMHAIAMEGEKNKAARQEIKAKMVSLRREKDDLRDELEKIAFTYRLIASLNGAALHGGLPNIKYFHLRPQALSKIVRNPSSVTNYTNSIYKLLYFNNKTRYTVVSGEKEKGKR
jgi:hypothetical protein